MDLGPTPEQLAKDRYEAPQRDQKRNQTAFRRKSLLETIRLEPEHLEAGRKLYKYRRGAEGADVRENDEPTFSFASTPDEFFQHRCSEEEREARRAVRSDRTWKVLCLLVDDHHQLHEIGRAVGPYKDRAQATSWAYGVIEVGLDVLALHWGLVRRPDG